MAHVSFSDLPPEALDDIARRAGPLNNVVCSAVCRPWRRALKTTRLRLLERPSRLYSVRQDKWRNGTISLCLVRLGHTREPTIYVPIAIDDGAKLPTRIIGSSHGWLVTVDKECGLSLLEALTGRVFPLPPVASSGSKKVAKELEQLSESMFYKAALAPGRRLGAFAVMLIHGGGFGLSFLRPDAKSWTAVRVPKWMQNKYTDVVFHHGAFYTASRDGEVTAWALDASSSGLHAKRVSEPTQECMWAALVESIGGDDLLMVSSFVVEEDFAAHGQWYRLPRRRYAVSRYDGEREGTSSWLPVEDLGEVAIFVGSSCSMCVSTRGSYNDLRNRLYFAWPSYESGKYYCFHPDEYRLPTATAGYTYLIVPYYGGSWFVPYVSPEFHWY
uniref:F-box domain-containing protein n=1 Tax=Oryza punctata TaxID=4537 RepID=A0A0E0JTH4_ORYPU